MFVAAFLVFSASSGMEACADDDARPAVVLVPDSRGGGWSAIREHVAVGLDARDMRVCERLGEARGAGREITAQLVGPWSYSVVALENGDPVFSLNVDVGDLPAPARPVVVAAAIEDAVVTLARVAPQGRRRSLPTTPQSVAATDVAPLDSSFPPGALASSVSAGLSFGITAAGAATLGVLLASGVAVFPHLAFAGPSTFEGVAGSSMLIGLVAAAFAIPLTSGAIAAALGLSVGWYLDDWVTGAAISLAAVAGGAASVAGGAVVALTAAAVLAFLSSPTWFLVVVPTGVGPTLPLILVVQVAQFCLLATIGAWSLIGMPLGALFGGVGAGFLKERFGFVSNGLRDDIERLISGSVEIE